MIDPLTVRPTGDDRTLAGKAYRELRSMLARGELSPGQRLVNRTLADQIGVSFTPVREAIRQLASEGLVEYVNGAGAFVRSPSRQELKELYDLRETLEPFAVSQAAAHIASAEVAELRSICDRWRVLAEQLRTEPAPATLEQMRCFLDADARFHEVIYEASRNRWLTKIARDLRLVVHAFSALRETTAFLTAGRAEETHREHLECVRLLESRDAEALREWMVAHVRNGRESVLGFLSV